MNWICQRATGATKLAIIGDYDTVLSLDLLKKAEAEREKKEKAASQQSAGGFTVVSEDGTADEGIENLIRLSETNEFETFRNALESLYGPHTLTEAKALLTREKRFFEIPMPGLKLDGCLTHRRLLEAYAKVHHQPAPEKHA